MSAEFSNQTVQMFITGFAFSNLLLSVYYIILDQFKISLLLLQHIFRFGFAILINIGAMGAYLYIRKMKPVKMDEGKVCTF